MLNTANAFSYPTGNKQDEILRKFATIIAKLDAVVERLAAVEAKLEAATAPKPDAKEKPRARAATE